MDGKSNEIIVAGMGGEETVKIVAECVDRVKADRLILQPMKNPEKVRKFVLENGFKTERDFTFYYSDKFYDTIVAVRGETTPYTAEEYEFGRENLAVYPDGFVKKLEKEIADITEWLSAKGVGEDGKKTLLTKLAVRENLLRNKK
ncbi:MAG: class I SAM-dependent methyltransferase [Clostridia bacterium]|nr:class I SAM-dependent methyltransferase [Clostridia bacterium]